MNVSGFLQTLPYMLEGMLGIFAVTLLLMFGIFLLNKLTGPVQKPEQQEENQ